MEDLAESIERCKNVQELAVHVARDHSHLRQSLDAQSDFNRRLLDIDTRVGSLEHSHERTFSLLEKLVQDVGDIKMTLVAPMGEGGFIHETNRRFKDLEEATTNIKTKITYWAGGLAVVGGIVAFILKKL